MALPRPTAKEVARMKRYLSPGGPAAWQAAKAVAKAAYEDAMRQKAAGDPGGGIPETRRE